MHNLLKTHKITLLSGLGVGLEYYDFVIYVMLSHYLSLAFFPAGDETQGILGVLGIFSAGYLIRPIGGILFGSLGDRLGRRKIFVISISLMAVSTLSIGLIPRYAQIGITAPVLLTLFRLVQGISLGAEMPGAITFLMEHVDKDCRGTHCGFMFMSLGLGAMLSSLISFIVTATFSVDVMASYGFRIPFLIGALLAIICFYLRRSTLETPVFTRSAAVKRPFLTLIISHPKKILTGIGLNLFNFCLVIFSLYMPTYVHRYFEYPMHTAYLVNTASLVWSALLLPCFGFLSDKIGRKIMLCTAAVCMIFLIYPLFYLLTLKTTAMLFVFTILFQTVIAVFSACYPPMLTENFPTKVRYSGVALCYNVAVSIASFTPLVATLWIHYTDRPLMVTFLFSAVALITLIAGLFFNGKTRAALPE